MRKQDGFGHIAIVIILVVILVIGLVGYSVFKRRNTSPASNTATRMQKEAATISDKSSMTEAIEQLKTIDTNTKNDEDELRSLVQ